MNTKNKLAEHKNRCSKFVLCVKKIVHAPVKGTIGEKGFAPENKKP